jgi:hypothetical protein
MTVDEIKATFAELRVKEQRGYRGPAEREKMDALCLKLVEQVVLDIHRIAENIGPAE